MLLISHRGNVDSVKPELENTLPYIQAAIDAGFDVEIDIRRIHGEYWLGHDGPEHRVNLRWLEDRGENLWLHTKNFEAMCYLMDSSLRIFFHEKEKHTPIINSSIIWSHDLTEANWRSIIPLLSEEEIRLVKAYPNVHGVCSDFVALSSL